MKKFWVLIAISCIALQQYGQTSEETTDVGNKSLLPRPNCISYSILSIPYGNMALTYERFLGPEMSIKAGGLINVSPSSSLFDRRLGYIWAAHAGMNYYPVQEGKNKFFTGISARRGELVDVFYIDNQTTLRKEQYTYQYVALLLNNGIFIQVNKILTINIELGLGFKRLQRVEEVDLNRNEIFTKEKIKNIELSPDMQLGFSIGFRI